jgi:hypothetical protein
MVAIGTVKVAAVTVVPLITSRPVTEWPTPTAVWPCPSRTSLTRYSTSDPLPIVHVPATLAPEAACAPAAPAAPGRAEGVADGFSESCAGA